MAIQIPATGHGPQVTFNKYIPDTTHKLCSVFPRPFYFHNHNGSYELPACTGKMDFTFVEVRPGLDRYDLGEDKHVVAQAIPSKTIAEDYAGILNGSTDLTDRGVFVPAGEIPTPEEVTEAREKLAKWAASTVGKADRMWAQNQKISDISDDAKLAAGVLSIEREWAKDFVPVEKIACPVCGEPMNKGAKIHSIGQKGCGQRIGWGDDGVPYWADEKKGPAPANQK